jgi:hypothetical protein
MAPVDKMVEKRLASATAASGVSELMDPLVDAE